MTIVSTSAITDASGNYAVTGLANGTNTVTPAPTGTVFPPASRSVTTRGAELAGVSFVATGQPADVGLAAGVRIHGYVTSSVPGAGWPDYWLDAPPRERLR